MDAIVHPAVIRRAAPYAVFTAIQSESRVLMVNDLAGRQYTLPGGRGTREETIANAALRKVREETGIDFAADSIKQIAFRLNGKSYRPQPQYLFSILVADSFFSCVRETGPDGHVLTVLSKHLLAKALLPEHIVALIRKAGQA